MNYAEMTTDSLGDLFSDWYKDTHGSRPRHISYDDREGLIAGLEQLGAYHDKMNETFAGREELREGGWIIKETDPVLQQQAYWLAKERDQWRLDNWGETFNEARHYEVEVSA